MVSVNYLPDLLMTTTLTSASKSLVSLQQALKCAYPLKNRSVRGLEQLLLRCQRQPHVFSRSVSHLPQAVVLGQRRHPNKSRRWTAEAYWHPSQGHWAFASTDGLTLSHHCRTPIRRHIMVHLCGRHRRKLRGARGSQLDVIVVSIADWNELHLGRRRYHARGAESG